MNKFLNGMIDNNNYTLTENGALTHKTTKSAVYDMFALGGAMRNRSDNDIMLMFKNAMEENPTLALRCLFYLRDVRGGQGERRFFRTCVKYGATAFPEAMKRNMKMIPEYGRWDDLYSFVGTPLERDAFKVIKNQLELDVTCKTPSLLAKWLKSENASSAETIALANKTRTYLGMNHKQYRKTLSILRARINVLETLMSAGRWDEIEFDKIPSRAGMIYKNAFARHDVERARAGARTYEDFAKDVNSKVNAGALYPYEVVEKAINEVCGYSWTRRNNPVSLNDTNRLMINKYWDNLTDYFKNASFNGICVCDTSGSMTGTPMNVAISLSLYCAEKAKGPFAGHYISFASRPQLIKTEGVDFCDKVGRIYKTNLCDNTNIEATFDMMLNTALRNHCTQEDLPKNIIVISDMEFDMAVNAWGYHNRLNKDNVGTLMEEMSERWRFHGYKMPNLVFWNVNARQNNIPMATKDGVTFVSGMSPVLFEQIMSGKTSYDLMLDKLNSKRYEAIK